MFQFPRFPSLAGYLSMTSSGLPHSEISGSMPACGSPKLIAAFYVLHRLLAPRHPPYALSNLTYVALVYTFVWRRCSSEKILNVITITPPVFSSGAPSPTRSKQSLVDCFLDNQPFNENSRCSQLRTFELFSTTLCSFQSALLPLIRFV
jgi:hypothetical protein